MISAMKTVRLGKKGQVSIPKPILRRLGLVEDALLVVETTPDGGILLRPAGVYPLELYSDKRLREFQKEDRIMAKETAWVRKRTRRSFR
jgi:AbrB family looped-hinge helix DNA binding protein